jgi:hypothetical protein
MVTGNGKTRKTLFILAGLLVLIQTSAIAGQTVNARTVAERMDKSKYTSSDIKSYLKGLKGKQVAAEGRIKDVLSGKTGNRVVILVDTAKSRDFIVDVYVDNPPRLHKGEVVSCKGEYVKYNPFTVNGITLKKGTCSKN